MPDVPGLRARDLGIPTGADGSFTLRASVSVNRRPISIDADSFAAAMMTSTVRARRLREALAAGRSHRHRPAGLFEGTGQPLRAFARLLGKYPSIDAGQLPQIAARSRKFGRYQRLRRELDQLVGDTNGRFSEFDWVPLRCMTRGCGGRPWLVSHPRRSRYLTPLRDGMNLVAKEFVAAHDPQDRGADPLFRRRG
jgi:trehalose 6-phosphate synthase